MISIDTNVMIWGVKRVATPGQEPMIPLGVAVFEYCKREHLDIIVPTQVLEEFLVDYSDEERTRQLEIIQANYIVPPLDAAAAAIAAKLRHDKDLLDGIRQEFGITRQVIKADINILATSISAQATRVVAFDAHMRKLAQGMILVHTLPEFVETVVAPSLSHPASSTPSSRTGQNSLFGPEGE